MQVAERPDDSWKWAPSGLKPERRPDGILVGGQLFRWEYFDVTPNETVRSQLRRERKRGEERAAKRAKEAVEKKLSAPADAKAPRYFMTSAGWSWHVFDPRQGGLVDTGLGPGPHGTAYPPDEWEQAVVEAALAAIDKLRGRDRGAS